MSRRNSFLNFRVRQLQYVLQYMVQMWCNHEYIATSIHLYVLMYVVLAWIFASWSLPLIVMAIIPFALVGGIVALWVTGEYLSVPASVGFIALLGIAVLNGIVLVSYFNQLHGEGLPLREVVLQGARRRLRPVLMTASITASSESPRSVCSSGANRISA